MSLLSQVVEVVREEGAGTSSWLRFCYLAKYKLRLDAPHPSASEFAAALSCCKRLGYVVATGERRHRVYRVTPACRQPGRQPPRAKCVTCPACGASVEVGAARPTRAKK